VDVTEYPTSRLTMGLGINHRPGGVRGNENRVGAFFTFENMAAGENLFELPRPGLKSGTTFYNESRTTPEK